MKHWQALPLLLPVACGNSLDVGSNLLWSVDHESGDFAAWTKDDEGGVYTNEADTAAEVVAERAHSGQYSIKLTSPANGVDGGPGVFRHFGNAGDAYYGVWYFIPRAYATVSYWTILRFRPSSPADPANSTLGIDVNLRSLPDAQITLEVVHQRQAYLHWPVAVPTPVVPTGHWFQLEVRFRSATDQTGMFKLWLDGRLLYDIEDRVTNTGQELYFTPCNVTNTMTPAPVEIYLDDVMVSRTRITPDGRPN